MDIESFKGAFSDLARPNRFQIILPRAGNLQFFCKASSAPEDHVSSTDVNYFGRIIKVPGDRDNPDWSITIYLDTTYSVYNALQTWLSQCNDPAGNTGSPPAAVKEDAIVHHMGRDDSILNSWNLVGAFPTQLGAVEMDWGNNNTISTCQCTFAYDYVLPQ